jgi:hypothetical protein
MRANQQINVDSVSTANLAKAGLDNSCAESNQQKMIDTSTTTDLVQAKLNLGKAKSDTHTEFVKVVDTSFVEQEHGECETIVLDFSGCKEPFMLPYEFRAKEVDEHQQEENMAEPSLVEEEHLSEEAQDSKKKEDKMLKNHQEAEQGSEKNMVIDDNAPLKMIMPKNPEVRVSNVNERKTQSAPRSKPTVKNLLDKYTSRKFKNVFNRLGGSKRRRSPTRPGGHVRWREKSYNQQYYFPMARTYWSCSPPTYPQFPPRGYIPWAPYLTNSESYCQA